MMTPGAFSPCRRTAVAFSMVFAVAGSGGCSSDDDKTAGDESIAPSSAPTTGDGAPATAMTSTMPTEAPSPENTASPGATVTTSSTTTPTTSSTDDGNVSAGGANGGGMAGAGSGAGGSGGESGSSENTGGATVGAGGSGGDDASGGSATGGSQSVGGSGGAGEVTGAGGDGGSGTEEGMTDPQSPGCGTPISRPDRNEQQTMEIGGTTRYYLLDVPQNADNETPLALIFGLHGFDMNNVAVKDLYNFTERSNGQAITVMPQGEGPPPGDVSHWGDGVLESTWAPNQANFDYLQALMTTLGESYCIDRSRVFIVGFSMGAFFTNAIACEHNDWFRAFAPIAGGGPTSCADGVQAAIMIQHGTADPIVEISSGEGSRDTWVEQNGCSQSSTPSFNGCESYDGCPEGKPVVWCTGNYDHYIPENVVANIWSFFSEF